MNKIRPEHSAGFHSRPTARAFWIWFQGDFNLIDSRFHKTPGVGDTHCQNGRKTKQNKSIEWQAKVDLFVILP